MFTALSVISNPASEFYRKMMEDGLINSSFSNEVFSGDGYFAAISGGESRDPHEVYDRLMNEIERVKKEGIDPALFESIKKYTYGSAIRELESPEQAASLLINSYFSEVTAFDGIKVISEMTCDDVMTAVKNRLNPETAVLSIIEP